ncbi:MAG: FGGY-family carbohydrate kinase [bacterium]
MKHLIMCIDIGTTGCHTVIFNEFGELLKQAYQEYKSIYLSSRWIDHDPKTWLHATQKTVKEVLKKIGDDKTYLSAIAVTSQRATFIPVDKSGEPLDNAILWQDKRAIEEAQYLVNEFGSDMIYDTTGLKIDPYFTLPKLLWLKKNKKDVYHHSSMFLSVQDFIVHYLTGEFSTDWTQASRTMLFNINQLQWDRDLIKSVGVDFAKLPEAIPPGSLVGNVIPNVSEDLNLPQGLPVIAAGGDQQCAAIGLGVIKSGMVEVNTGTGSFILTHSDKPVKDDEQRLICSASSLAGNWVLEASIFTTGSIYRWFRDVLELKTMGEQEEMGVTAYKIMDLKAVEEPIGANGLLLIPHFAASAAPYWNPEARGVLFGLALGHKRSSIIRAILEGIAFEIQKNINIMESNIGKIKEVRISGGSAKSEIFNQIQADVYGIPVVKTELEEASALGAGILAATTVGLYDSIGSAAKKMIKVRNESQKEPIAENHKVYKELAKIHHEIYSALEKGEVYHKLNEVTKVL